MDTHRFSLNDLSTQAPWFIPRLIKVYSHLTERSAATWLRNVMDQSDTLFLASDKGLSCTSLVHPDTFSPKAVIQERFTWVADPADKDQVKEALAFYDAAYRWGQGLGVNVFLLCEYSDVPAEVLRERFKRVLTRQQSFLRVS